MIVIDASVSVKWVLPEADSDKADALRSEVLAAPAIWLSEVSNTLWRYVRISKISEAEARDRLQRVRNVGVVIASAEVDAERALALAVELDHPVYDCFYLALAIRESSQVVTADERFAAAVHRHRKWSAYIQRLSDR